MTLGTTARTPLLRPERQVPIEVGLTEWSRRNAANDPRLAQLSLQHHAAARKVIDALRGRVEIRQGFEGIEIESTSFVGQVNVGPLSISITPKLPAIPLITLLCYAYGLRNLLTFEDTLSPLAQFGFQDLLIAMLRSEVEELLHGGLPRRYVPRTEMLESPRGRILIDSIMRRGGIREARLPCLHFERQSDWHLNQVLRTGLARAAMLTNDGSLRIRLSRLGSMFGHVTMLTRFGLKDILRAEEQLTRLTASFQPALTIIRLLMEGSGVNPESDQDRNPIPGYLFDMNMFFQRLLSRFFRENLVAIRIEDEEKLRGVFKYADGANPRHARVPAPRPDFAIYGLKGLSGFADAKYRDIWDHGFPPEWLYQLSIYALAAPDQMSIMLYATSSTDAKEEILELRQPAPMASRRMASVIVRPVPLNLLAALLHPQQMASTTEARRLLAERLLTPMASAGCAVEGNLKVAG